MASLAENKERVWVCQKYITDKELLIEKLQTENEKLKRTMRLHAGDCCSLANEVESFRSRWEDAENRCDKLEAITSDLLAALESAVSILHNNTEWLAESDFPDNSFVARAEEIFKFEQAIAKAKQ